MKRKRSWIGIALLQVAIPGLYASSFGTLCSTYNHNTNIGVRPAMWVKLDTPA